MQALIPSFRAFMSQPQSFQAYDRGHPLHMDLVDWDDTGCFTPWNGSPQSSVFQANCEMRVEFHLNVLFSAPPDGFWVACWLFHNQLPTVVGDASGEAAGFDLGVRNYAGNPPASAPQANNLSVSLTQSLHLQAGDKVWPVAGSATNTSCIGYNIVNYFTGKILAK